MPLVVMLGVAATCGGRQAARYPTFSGVPHPGELILQAGTLDAKPWDTIAGRRSRVHRAFLVEFGQLAVPENRRSTASRLITLPVLRIRATGSHPIPPVFWLGGGPGRSNMRNFDRAFLLPDHDYVFVGYRGVDGSVSLQCQEVVEALRTWDDLLDSAALARIGDAYARCAVRLRDSGIDIDGYTPLDVVDDLEDARRALGYETVDLLGESYGTRIAYLYSVKYAARVGRSVLVGANPPGGFVWEPRTVERLLRAYGERWAVDSVSRARTSDLVATIARVNANMPTRWLGLPIRPGTVKVAAFALLAERGDAARVFDAYVAAERGDRSGLWLLSFASRFIFPGIVNWGDNASKALSSDYDPRRDYVRELMPPGAALGSPLGALLWAPARRWPITPMPDQ